MNAFVASVASPARGLLGAVAGTDHKASALRLGLASAAFFVLGGVLALLIRLELLEPGMQLMSHNGYNAVFSMHGSVMIYLVVIPLGLALGLYLVPLQIGAADVAAPRAALLGVWLVIGGGLLMLSGFLTTSGPDRAGWTAFFPLSNSVNSPGIGMDFWVMGVLVVTVGTIAIAACILATAIGRRAPGMTLLRMPIFTWGQVVTCLMVLTAFPALVVAMALLGLDRVGVSTFGGSFGPVAYQHLFWFYGHPAVYVMFFPFLGAVADVIATFSRRRWFGYPVTVVALLVFTSLSMSVWAHHMFATGRVENKYFSLTSTALVVPAGIEYFAAIATMIGGSIVLRTPMLFAVGFLAQFLIGGVTGVFVGSPPLDYHVHDTYFVVAHFHYTLFAGSLFGFFAGLYYWWPKATGWLLREGLGRWHFGLLAIGTNLTFMPMFALGYDGMPRRVADYTAASGFQGLNEVATLGSWIVAIAMLVLVANVVVSWRAKVPAGPDPWEGQTLEWATSSPPPRHNFATLPPIHSYAPLLDLREAADAAARADGAGGGDDGGGGGGGLRPAGVPSEGPA